MFFHDREAPLCPLVLPVLAILFRFLEIRQKVATESRPKSPNWNWPKLGLESTIAQRSEVSDRNRDKNKCSLSVGNVSAKLVTDKWPITRTRSGHDIFYITHFVTQLKDFQIHRLTPKKSKGRVFIYFYNQSLLSYSRTSKFQKMKFKKSYRKQLDARILTLGDLNFKRWNVVPSWVSDMKCASSDIATIW